MRVLAVTHGPDVRPEVFADVIAEDGHELVEWDIRSRGVPASSDFDAVIVLGGDQNVGEELEHPWLHEEYDALRRWVDEERRCSRSASARRRWRTRSARRCARSATRWRASTSPSSRRPAQDDPVLGVLPQRFESFNANGYWFEIPPGAVELATGPVPQAYRVNGSAWGVQFHPEVRRDQVLGWFEGDETVTRTLDDLADELDEKLPAWQEHGQRLCRAFLAAASK